MAPQGYKKYVSGSLLNGFEDKQKLERTTCIVDAVMWLTKEHGSYELWLIDAHHQIMEPQISYRATVRSAARRLYVSVIAADPASAGLPFCVVSHTDSGVKSVRAAEEKNGK